MAEAESGDHWARWVLHDRFGGCEEARRASLMGLELIRDRVLDNAEIKHGDVVLDVGCGDGLIGFGALARVGRPGKVIFSDVSQNLLNECARASAEMGTADRCTFINTRAETLAGIPSESVDVVATRSVLIYVDDKQAAFESFHRVLRLDGRVSIFEPINRRMNELNRSTFLGFDSSGVEELAGKVQHVFEQSAPQAMTGFDETDLFRLAEDAGFRETQVTLELKSSQPPFGSMDWSVERMTSPNPLAPTVARAIDLALTPAEAERFERHMASAMNKARRLVNRSAYAFVKATKGDLG